MVEAQESDALCCRRVAEIRPDVSIRRELESHFTTRIEWTDRNGTRASRRGAIGQVRRAVYTREEVPIIDGLFEGGPLLCFFIPASVLVGSRQGYRPRDEVLDVGVPPRQRITGSRNERVNGTQSVGAKIALIANASVSNFVFHARRQGPVIVPLAQDGFREFPSVE